MIFSKYDPIIFNGEHGIIRGVYPEHYSVSVDFITFDVKEDEISRGVMVEATKEILRCGYKVDVKPFSLTNNSLFNTCMENPRGFYSHVHTYYFGGYSRVEALEFVSWFNEMFTFATISLEQDERFDVIGAAKNGFYSSIYLEPGENWTRIVYKIELKYPNRFVVKFLCVLLRAYFVKEQYNTNRIIGKLKGNSPIKILNSVISSSYRKSHYFSRKVNILQALQKLEESNYSYLNSNIYSQTGIYFSILDL